ncbi:MAG: lipid-A-disaccharide synthase [Legionellales bacterium]|nr:lipid-A-disaccharide synthase [Legionellales bacterium]
MAKKPLCIAIVAAEDSGDILGADLIMALRQYYPDAKFIGVAGSRMLSVGCESLIPLSKLSVMGIIEVLKQLRQLLKLRNTICDFFIKNPPDVYIGIDAPDFNLPIEKKLKSQGIPTVHYVSPTIWAWREKRIHKIAKSVDMMLTVFPFEAAFYEKYGIPVRFVGHPLADKLLPSNDVSALRKKLSLPQKALVIALLSGSRKSELTHIAPSFIQAAQQSLLEKPDLIFITAAPNQQRADQFRHLLNKYAPNLSVTIYIDQSRDVIAAADLVLLASGTATLETLLLGKPMIVGYKVPWLNYIIGKILIKIDKFALPNILASEHIVPEFIQTCCTADNLKNTLLEQLANLPMSEMLDIKYEKIREGLKRNASEHAAYTVSQIIDAHQHAQKIEI